MTNKHEFMTRLDILMITYNRPGYTALALKRLLESCSDQMRVWVWHNGNHRETLDVVRSFASHPRLYKLHHSPENQRLNVPTRWLWEQSEAEFVSKVDDDCLLPDGWGDTLMAAHDDNPELGVIGAWRFPEEDFVPELAKKKIRSLKGGHQIMENCWVQGSGYILRRQVVKELGGLKEESFSNFCIRAALKGWKNGWYYPFIREEHMDDPRSEFCEIKTDEDFMAQRPLSAINDNVTTVAEWAKRVKYMAKVVQAASPNPLHYHGWRLVARKGFRKVKRLLGVKEEWRK